MSRAHRFRKGDHVLCHHLSSLYEAKVEQSKFENHVMHYQLSFPALSTTEWVDGDLVVKDTKENRELKAKLEKENKSSTTTADTTTNGDRGGEKQGEEEQEAAEEEDEQEEEEDSKTSRSTKRTYKRKRTRESLSADSSSANKKKKQRTRRQSRDEESESEEEDSIERLDKRPAKLQIELSEQLRRVLKEDCEQCTQTQKPYKLPFSESIEDIVDEYLQERRVDEKEDSNEFQLAKTVLTGAKNYFNALARRALLYPCEKKQYDTYFKTGSRIPCAVYGMTHLLRLYVKLPIYLTRTEIGEAGSQVIQEQTGLFLTWLSARKAL